MGVRFIASSQRRKPRSSKEMTGNWVLHLILKSRPPRSIANSLLPYIVNGHRNLPDGVSQGNSCLSGAVTALCAAPATLEQRLLGALSAEELWLQQDPVSRNFQTSQATSKPRFQYLNCFLCLQKHPRFCLSTSSPSPSSYLRRH